MSYYGSLVLARSPRRITAEPAIENFGIGHQYLRELGGGWQLLETGTSASYAINFPAGVRGWTEATGDAVLAVNVTDMCATVLAAAPGAPDVAIHMPDPTEECRTFQHAHPVEPMPVEAAVAALAGWAAGVGLTADPAYLRWVLAPRADDDDYVRTADLVFELVLALGIPAITPSLVPRIDPCVPPYSTVTAKIGGLAAVAWVELRHGPKGQPPPDWVTDAMVLEERIWHALFAEEDVDIAELQRDIGAVVAAHQRFRQASGPPAEQVMMGGRPVVSAQHLAESIRGMLASGQLISFGWTDSRPQEHPIYRPARPPRPGS